MEDATMAYNGLKVDEYTKTNYTVTNADIIEELISNYGYKGKITEVTAGEVSSIIIGNIGQVVVGETTTVGINKVGANSIYFVEIKGKYYPIHFENNKITVVGSEAQDSATATDAKVSFTATSSGTDIVEANAKNIDGVLTVDLMGKSRGNAEVTVKYGNIEQKVNVNVKGKTQITFVAENDSSGNAKGTITSPTTATAEYVDGEKITLAAEGIGEYSLLGWYIGDRQITVDENNQYIVEDNLSNQTTVVAKFGEKGIYVSFEESTGTLRFYDHSKEDTESEVFYKDKNGNAIDIKDKSYNYSNKTPWNTDTNNITIVNIESKIFPTNTSCWFYNMNNLAKLIGIENMSTENVTDMSSMFSSCKILTNIDVSQFNTTNVTNMTRMFYECSGLINLDVSGFNTANVTNMDSMFARCSNLSSLDLSSFDTSKVIRMFQMFSLCQSIESIDVSSFDTSNVEDMQGMFSQCYKLKSLNISSFDTSNVKYINGMFGYCTELESIDVENFDTSKVNSMMGMFSGCSKLKSLDVSKFETSSVTGMSSMFANCSSLEYLNVGNFDTSSVTSMEEMFCNCSRLTNLDISKFNTSNVINMAKMFYGCSCLTVLDISSFNTLQVTKMDDMFRECGNLTTIYASTFFSTTKVTASTMMFYNCRNLRGGNGTYYLLSRAGKTYARLDEEGTPGFFTDIKDKPSK